MTNFAAEARCKVEAEAIAVRCYDGWSPAHQVDGRPFVTVAGGRLKKEGELIVDMVQSEAELPGLVERFVSCCLSIKDGATLVWRRFPSVEKDSSGKIKLTARIAWLP